MPTAPTRTDMQGTLKSQRMGQKVAKRRAVGGAMRSTNPISGGAGGGYAQQPGPGVSGRPAWGPPPARGPMPAPGGAPQRTPGQLPPWSQGGGNAFGRPSAPMGPPGDMGPPQMGPGGGMDARMSNVIADANMQRQQMGPDPRQMAMQRQQQAMAGVQGMQRPMPPPGMGSIGPPPDRGGGAMDPRIQAAMQQANQMRDQWRQQNPNPVMNQPPPARGGMPGRDWTGVAGGQAARTQQMLQQQQLAAMQGQQQF